jgi:hypothetical protein
MSINPPHLILNRDLKPSKIPGANKHPKQKEVDKGCPKPQDRHKENPLQDLHRQEVENRRELSSRPREEEVAQRERKKARRRNRTASVHL